MSRPRSEQETKQAPGGTTPKTVISITVDQAGNILAANDAARQFAPSLDPLHSIALIDLVYEEDRALVRDLLDRRTVDPTLSTGIEFRLRANAGTYRWIQAALLPGEGVGEISLIGFDVTDRFQGEQELRLAERRFQEFLDTTSDLIYTTDLEGNILAVNRACESLTGYSRQEAMTMNIADVIAPEHLAFVRNTVEQKLAGTGARVYETELLTKDGARVAVEISSHLLLENGRPVGLQGIARDITDRQRVAQELQSSQDRFVKAFAAGPVAMLIVRMADGLVLDLNDAALRYFGYDREWAVGKSTLQLGLWPDPDVRARALQELRRNGSLRDFEVTLRGRNADLRDLVLSAEVIILNGEPCALWVSQDITERKQAEDALKQNQQRYALATQAGRTGVWDVVLGEGSIYVDPSLIALLGYDGVPETNQTSFWSKVVHPDDFPAVVAAVQANITNQTQYFDFEHRARHGSGEWRWMHTRGYVLRDATGRPVRLVGTATEVNTRKLAEEALRESEERYRTFIENSMEAVWRLELEHPVATSLSVDEQITRFFEKARLAECNDTLAQMYGFKEAEEMIGIPIDDFLPISDPENLEYFHAFINSGYRLTEAESRELDRFGHPKVFLNNLIGIVENDHLIRVWGTQQDVTRRRQTEALLRGEQRVLKSIATGAALNETLRELVLFVEEQRPGLRGSVLLTSSDGTCLRMGVAPNLPSAFNEAVDGMAVGPTSGVCGAAAYLREPVIVGNITTDPRCIDWRWVPATFGIMAVWSSPILSAAGNVLGTFALYRTVPAEPDEAERELVAVAANLASVAIEHTNAERALRASEQRFSQAFSASPNAMAIISARNGVFLDVNEAFCEDTGYAREELLCRSVQELAMVADPSVYDDLARDLKARIPVRNRELMGRNRRGELRAHLVSMEPVELNAEKCLLCAITDITDRKRSEAALRDSEERLRQSQKMEAVGRLAGGIAHDFNNILTGIIGYSDMTLFRMERDSPLRKNLEGIRRAADRAANLTHQLLAYSRRQILQPSFLDVNAIVLDMDQMLRRLIGEDIVLRTNLGRFEGFIKADRGQLEQVLMNLAVNARDAMPKGGSLTLATCALDLNEPKPVGAFKLRPGKWMHLSVTDTGVGMSEAVKGQIFEPFFTTKEVGKGTGLGLATVFGIVKQSGGYIDVESKPDEGARFNIYLPRVIETAEVAAVDTETEVPHGEETILLIEDDPTVRALAREVLELNGYHILEARNGEEALKIAAGPVLFQLLLTDVVMPGQSGRELADQLLADRSDLRVLFMSGYTDDAIVHHGVLEDGLDFIQKPFSPDALARRVRVVLDR